MPISSSQLAVALSRELEYRRPYVVSRKTRKYPYFEGRTLSQKGDLPLGAKDIVVELEDGRAEAIITAGDVSDVPVAEVNITEDKYKIVEIKTAVRYTHDELETQDFLANSNRRSWNFIEKRMKYADMARREKAHLIGAFGMAKYGIKGALNNDYPVFTESFDPYAITSANAYDLVDWFVNHVDEISDDSDMTLEPNIAAVTQKLHTKLLTTRPTGDSSKNVYQLILEACSPMGLTSIVKLNELRSKELEDNGVHATGTNLDRMHLYTLSTDESESLCRHFSPVRIYPPEYRNGGYKVIMGQSFSSVILNYTNSGRYVDYPKAS